KRHATELFHLSTEERGALIEDVSVVADALAKAFKAVKINYELLGNQVPHIHWHLIPRLAEDPAPLQPVWTVPHAPIHLASPVLEHRVALVRTLLNAPQSG